MHVRSRMFAFGCGVSLVIYWLGQEPLCGPSEAPLREARGCLGAKIAPCPVSGFPAPKRLEARAMPTQDSLRFHNLGYSEQSGTNPRRPYQQRPVTTVRPRMRRRSPQCDVELMTEKQVLGFEPASRLEDVGAEPSRVSAGW